MQPFDDIASPDELGLEDDVLVLTPTSSPHSSRAPQWQPKWMRSPQTSSFSTSTLSTLLRPRLTAGYLVLSALALYITYCLLTSQPLLASNLPPYTGPYSVGALDLDLPVPTGPQRINNLTFKTAPYKPAFEVQSVLFTLYYPTSLSSNHNKNKHLYWIPKPISSTATGYLRFLHLAHIPLLPQLLTFALWCIAGSITIPAHLNAPLLAPPQNDDDDDDNDNQNPTWPVMVFSHGMLSSRTDYTHYLGELASRGIVVAAIEHRDGSSPASYFGLSDLATSTDDEPLFNTTTLKEAQIAFRQREITAVVSILDTLNNDSSSYSSSYSTFHNRLNTTALTIAGHSYGASTILRYPPSPTTTAASLLALDPGKSSGPLPPLPPSTSLRSLAILQSQAWSTPTPSTLFYGRPHFHVVRSLVDEYRGGPGWFLTALGTSHASVTDAPLLEPVLLAWATGTRVAGTKERIARYVEVTREFVARQQGRRNESESGLLALSGREEDGVVRRDFDPADNAGMPVAWRKYWQLHVAPK